MSESAPFAIRRRSPGERLAYLVGKRAEMVERGQDTAFFDALFTGIGHVAVAQTLAEVLRKALREHWQACPSCSTGKLFDCTEGRRLLDLQVPGDAIWLAS